MLMTMYNDDDDDDDQERPRDELKKAPPEAIPVLLRSFAVLRRGRLQQQRHRCAQRPASRPGRRLSRTSPGPQQVLNICGRRTPRFLLLSPPGQTRSRQVPGGAPPSSGTSPPAAAGAASPSDGGGLLAPAPLDAVLPHPVLGVCAVRRATSSISRRRGRRAPARNGRL